MRLCQARPDTLVLRYRHAEHSGWDEARQLIDGLGHARTTAWGRSMVIGRTGGAAIAWQTSLLRGLSRRGETEVTVGAVACGTVGMDEGAQLAHVAASRFGELEDVTVARLDLAADVAGARPDDVGPADFVVRGNPRRTKRRARDVGYVDEWRACDASLTGWTVCPGGAVKLNLYDKRRELRRPESEHKRHMEYQAWTRGGWDGHAPVLRVEFQLRSKALRELDQADDPHAIDAGAVWGYCTERWARVIDTTSHARRDRADLHPLWREVQRADFGGSVEPADRVRHRAGPTAAGALGTVRALLASRGVLPDDASLRDYAAAWEALVQGELQRQHGDPAGYVSRGHRDARALYGGG